MSRRPKHVVPPMKASGRRMGAHRRKLCPCCIVPWLREREWRRGDAAEIARLLGVSAPTIRDARFGRSYGEVVSGRWPG